MRNLNPSYLSSVLAASAEKPCVSIYLPTHRSYPDVQQDRIRYKNLVRAAEDALAKTNPGPAARGISEKLHRLLDEDTFWGRNRDGLAVLASPSRFDVFQLPRTVPERAEVAETFHVKPLLRHVQSADRFHVLCVSRDRATLFEGNRYEIAPADVPGLPLTPAETHATETHQPQQSVTAAGSGKPLIEQGPDARVEAPPDVRRFYRTVDRAVTDLVSNPSGWPVVLVGTDDNLSEFRTLAKNPHLTAAEARGDWTKWTAHEIREQAWKALEPFYLERLRRIREDFGTAATRKLGTADLMEAAQNAVTGRVGTLLVDADKTLPGSIEFTTGLVRPAGEKDPQPGDMLDDLAELVLRNGGTVTVVPADQMPSQTGLAAIYRY